MLGVDGRHDGYARALYFLRQALLALPDAPGAALDGSKSLDTFVPSLGEVVRRPYAITAKVTLDQRAALEAERAKLATVPTPDGANAATWVEGFLAAGAELADLLAQRGTALGEVTGRDDVAALRGSLIALLGEVRTVLARENAATEAVIFAYADELQRLAAERNTAARRNREAKAATAKPGEPGKPSDPGKPAEPAKPADPAKPTT